MAKYKGRTVKLNKPFRTPSGSKKFAVYVKNRKTNRVQIVRFAQPITAPLTIIIMPTKLASGSCNLDSELTLIVSLSFFII